MTVIATVNPSALLATAPTAPAPTAPTAPAPTVTAPTAPAPTVTAPAPTATAPTVTRYSMFDYAEIVEDAFSDFVKDDIFGFYPVPVFTDEEIEEMKKECYSAYVKEKYEELNIDDIATVVNDYARENCLEKWELLDIGWAFIEEIAKRLHIPAVLFLESKVYNEYEKTLED